MTALTNTAIDAMAKGDELKDDRVRGLSIRRHTSGRSFMLYYRTRAGDQRRPKIGDYPLLSLARARELATNMLIRVASGEDPSADRSALRSAPTMDDLWDRCEREHWNRGKAWDKEAKRLYENHIKPGHGRTRVREFTYDDAAAVKEALRETPSDANHTIAVLSKMLNMAEKFGPADKKWRDLGSNPCQHVERFPARKRKRYAKPHEIPQVAALLEAEVSKAPPKNKAEKHRPAWQMNQLRQTAFVYLLIFSGARPSEIVNAEPHQIERRVKDDLIYGVLRLHGKTSDVTGEDRVVFLPPQAMAVIAKLPKEGIRLRHRDGSRGRHTITGLAGVPRALWKRIKPDGMWIRDWRRTFASVALSNGVSLDKVGELLGHSSAQTTKLYAFLMEDKAHDATALTAGVLEQMMTR